MNGRLSEVAVLFGVLLLSASAHSQELDKIALRDQLIQRQDVFQSGTTEKKMSYMLSIRDFVKENRESSEIMKPLTPILIRASRDLEYELRSVAVYLLRDMGPPAAESLERLWEILSKNSQEVDYWNEKKIRDQNDEIKRLKQAACTNCVDDEAALRLVSAKARIRIAGIGIDVDRYSTLDPVGRSAAADALAQLVVEIPNSLAPGSSLEEKAVNFLTKSAQDLELNAKNRQTVIEVLGYALANGVISSKHKAGIVGVLMEDSSRNGDTSEISRAVLETYSLGKM